MDPFAHPGQGYSRRGSSSQNPPGMRSLAGHPMSPSGSTLPSPYLPNPSRSSSFGSSGGGLHLPSPSDALRGPDRFEHSLDLPPLQTIHRSNSPILGRSCKLSSDCYSLQSPPSPSSVFLFPPQSTEKPCLFPECHKYTDNVTPSSPLTANRNRGFTGSSGGNFADGALHVGDLSLMVCASYSSPPQACLQCLASVHLTSARAKQHLAAETQALSMP